MSETNKINTRRNKIIAHTSYNIKPANLSIIDGRYIDDMLRSNEYETMANYISSISTMESKDKMLGVFSNTSYSGICILDEPSDLVRLFLLCGHFINERFAANKVINHLTILINKGIISKEAIEQYQNHYGAFLISTTHSRHHNKKCTCKKCSDNRKYAPSDILTIYSKAQGRIDFRIRLETVVCSTLLIEDETYGEITNFIQHNVCRSFIPILLGVYCQFTMDEIRKFSVVNLYELVNKRPATSLLREKSDEESTFTKWEPIYTDHLLDLIRIMKQIYSEELLAFKNNKCSVKLFSQVSGTISNRLRAIYSVITRKSPPDGFCYTALKYIEIVGKVNHRIAPTCRELKNIDVDMTEVKTQLDTMYKDLFVIGKNTFMDYQKQYNC